MDHKNSTGILDKSLYLKGLSANICARFAERQLREGDMVDATIIGSGKLENER